MTFWREEEEQKQMALIVFAAFLLMLVVLICSLTGCTISFQNISSNGRATDLVDENQTASPSTELSGIPSF